ncbi:helix-turn-helix domain-containing protein [Paenibacillus oceani]|uniref:Helix-turn-helix transcriptional regulator n=1 Tax=Paenibacillus oceani TaxID=2772510 RepID=A0A927GYV4_9BACL|nr:helix-turn-helix transcriptional regulator [Paenibacillus oceani]MBD2860839.1 helix-turn-helix transcriptional regulator [Paenibacillus oceani]
MTFGARLKSARNSKRLTQQQVADSLGLNFTTISKYENDKSQPDNEILHQMSILYNVSIDWLLTGETGGGSAFGPGKAKVYFDGEVEELTEEEAQHVRDSLEMFRLLKEKRAKYDSSRKPDGGHTHDDRADDEND